MRCKYEVDFCNKHQEVATARFSHYTDAMRFAEDISHNGCCCEVRGKPTPEFASIARIW